MYRLYPYPLDIRPIVSHGKGQCLSEAEEDPRMKPEALPWHNKSTDLSQGGNESYIPLSRDKLILCLGYSNLSMLCRHRHYGVDTHQSVPEASIMLD